jgi:hypothetical protein
VGVELFSAVDGDASSIFHSAKQAQAVAPVEQCAGTLTHTSTAAVMQCVALHFTLTAQQIYAKPESRT